MPRLEGLVWDHPRATEPLAAATAAWRRLRPDVELVWRRRPLAAFEFQPIAEAAAGHDLLVYDHPFCGDVAASGCLLPVEGPRDADFVGPSLASYRLGGRVWAVPIDAACQVSAWRPDLVARLDEAPPATWAGTLRLAERARARGLRVAVALAGVHALMTFLGLCANLGGPCADAPDRPPVDPAAGRAALDALRALAGAADPRAVDWSSIAALDAMAGEPDLAFCPAVYGFATYAEPDRRHPLRFGPFAGPAAPHHAGSILGGAGLGLSARLAAAPERRAAAEAFAAFLAGARPQTDLLGRHRGQPARAEAWADPALDARFGGFFAATRATLEAARIRPRFAGYLGFQREGGAIVEAFLREPRRGDVAGTLRRLEEAWRRRGAGLEEGSP